MLLMPGKGNRCGMAGKFQRNARVRMDDEIYGSTVRVSHGEMPHAEATAGVDFFSAHRARASPRAAKSTANGGRDMSVAGRAASTATSALFARFLVVGVLFDLAQHAAGLKLHVESLQGGVDGLTGLDDYVNQVQMPRG